MLPVTHGHRKSKTADIISTSSDDEHPPMSERPPRQKRLVATVSDGQLPSSSHKPKIPSYSPMRRAALLNSTARVSTHSPECDISNKTNKEPALTDSKLPVIDSDSIVETELGHTGTPQGAPKHGNTSSTSSLASEEYTLVLTMDDVTKGCWSSSTSDGDMVIDPSNDDDDIPLPEHHHTPPVEILGQSPKGRRILPKKKQRSNVQVSNFLHNISLSDLPARPPTPPRRSSISNRSAWLQSAPCSPSSKPASAPASIGGILPISVRPLPPLPQNSRPSSLNDNLVRSSPRRIPSILRSPKLELELEPAKSNNHRSSISLGMEDYHRRSSSVRFRETTTVIQYVYRRNYSWTFEVADLQPEAPEFAVPAEQHSDSESDLDF